MIASRRVRVANLSPLADLPAAHHCKIQRLIGRVRGHRKTYAASAPISGVPRTCIVLIGHDVAHVAQAG